MPPTTDNVDTLQPANAGAARYVGSRINRVEDERLLTGRGTYVADVMLPGTLHAFFVRSPHARARIVGSTGPRRRPYRGYTPSSWLRTSTLGSTTNGTP